MTPPQMIEVTKLIGEYDVLDISHRVSQRLDHRFTKHVAVLSLADDTIIRVFDNGCIFWTKNDRRHRVDGPAVFIDGDKHWFLNGVEMTEEEHARRTKDR